jgi:hypothetical protein
MEAFDAKAPSREILRHEMYEVDEEIYTARRLRRGRFEVVR